MGQQRGCRSSGALRRVVGLGATRRSSGRRASVLGAVVLPGSLRLLLRRLVRVVRLPLAGRRSADGVLAGVLGLARALARCGLAELARRPARGGFAPSRRSAPATPGHVAGLRAAVRASVQRIRSSRSCPRCRRRRRASSRRAPRSARTSWSIASARRPWPEAARALGGPGGAARRRARRGRAAGPRGSWRWRAQAAAHPAALRGPWARFAGHPRTAHAARTIRAAQAATISRPARASRRPPRGCPPGAVPSGTRRGSAARARVVRLGAELERLRGPRRRPPRGPGTDQHPGVADHLGHRGHVHHHRHAAGEHRLGHREAEALVAGGLHVDRRARVESSSSSSESQPVNSTFGGGQRAQVLDRVVVPLARRRRSARRAGGAPPPRTAGGPSASASSFTIGADRERERLALRASVGSGPKGSGTPWWTTVTRSGGIGVFAAISRAAVVRVGDQPRRRAA